MGIAIWSAMKSLPLPWIVGIFGGVFIIILVIIRLVVFRLRHGASKRSQPRDKEHELEKEEEAEIEQEKERGELEEEELKSKTSQTTERHKLVESLINAQSSAEELIRLPKDHNIANTSPSGRGVIIIADDRYKVAINKLRKEHGSKYEYLRNSLLRGRALLNMRNRKNNISDFKSQLDKNSKEIIKYIDEIVNVQPKATNHKLEVDERLLISVRDTLISEIQKANQNRINEITYGLLPIHIPIEGGQVIVSGKIFGRSFQGQLFASIKSALAENIDISVLLNGEETSPKLSIGKGMTGVFKDTTNLMKVTISGDSVRIRIRTKVGQVEKLGDEVIVPLLT